MFNKFILLFFLFGCWLKYLEYPAGVIFYNVWAVLVITWIILNVLGMVAYAARKKPAIVVSEKTKTYWLAQNLIATLSFFYCGEIYLTLAFLCSSVVFMFVVFFTQPEQKKKRK